MCGIAGCYQQPDGYKLADIMTDRIAHRGPDAGGVWTHENDQVSVNLGHRRLSIIDLSAAADQPMIQGQPGHGLQRRAVQLQGDTAGAGRPRRPVRHELRHRGRGRGLALLGTRRAAEVPWHVRVRAGRHADRRAVPGPRPARHQAPVLPAQGRRRAVRLRAEGTDRRGRPRTADRAGRPGRVDALLLGARAVLRDRGRPQASRPAPGPGCVRTATSTSSTTGRSPT